MSSLAAARADNFYYPPDFDPVKHKSLNKYNGQHPLRERAKKIDEGILVIRFEVPFNIWCQKCGSHIAKGVRFNAEKKQVGNYFSTKIWSFSMHHHCGCKIVIQTDPKNTEYVCVEGARRKIETYTAKDAGVAELPDDEEKARLAADPIYRLEQGQASKARAAVAKGHIVDLREDRAVKWDATANYDLNKQLRAQLRERKKAAAEEQQGRKLHRLHQDVPLLPASEADTVHAQVAMLQHGSKAHSNWSEQRKSIMAQPIFNSSAGSSKAVVVAGAGGGSSAAGGMSAAGQKLLSNKLQALAKQQKAQQRSVLGKRQLDRG